MNNRPYTDNRNSQTTTPLAAKMIDLMGHAAKSGPIQITNDEWAALQQLYEMGDEEGVFENAVVARNILRQAEIDGFRIIAWLAHYIPQGEDPLKTVILAVMSAGWEVEPEDVSWAEED